MALVQKLGKPKEAETFGDFSKCFSECVLSYESDQCTRIDVVFDHYTSISIKSATRAHRADKHHMPIRRVISGCDVPLPKQWKLFMDMTENKKDLTNFLSCQLPLIAQNCHTKAELIVAGGYSDNEMVTSTKGQVSDSLVSDHEEADTRMLLHIQDAGKKGYKRIFVHCRDTDVIALLVAFYGQLGVAEIWVCAGTQLKRKYIPIKEIHNGLQYGACANLLAFHALTGCDTTSQFAGHGKRTAWKTYTANTELFDGLGRGDLSTDVIKSVERFVMKLYAPKTEVESVNEVRAVMFRSKNPEGLPPTQDALQQHIARASYQAMIWYKSLTPKPALPSPLECGWYHDPDDADCIRPILLTQEAIPKACMELISCACKRNCSRVTCKCRTNGLKCIPACGCFGTQCYNPVHDELDDN